MHEGRGGTSEDKLESEKEDAGQAGAMGERNCGNETINFTSCHSVASSPSKPSTARRPLVHHALSPRPAKAEYPIRHSDKKGLHIGI